MIFVAAPSHLFFLSVLPKLLEALCRAAKNMVSPPPEVLATIFSYLDPQDLDTVPLVCKTWRDNSGEKLWRRHFVDRFGTRDISFVSGAESTWREEYLTRLEILHRWKRHNLNTVSYNPTLGTITDLFSDLSGSRVIAFNRGRGMGNMSDPRVGKVARERLFAADFPMQQRVACIDSSRFAIICGFHDGRMLTMVFARSSHLILSYNHLTCRHDGAVSAVWGSKTHRPQSSASVLSFVSGGADGKVILVFGSRTDNFKESQLSEHRIEFVQGANNGDRIVAVDITGTVFWLDEEGTVVSTSRLPKPLQPDSTQIFISCGYVIAKYEKDIYRITPDKCEKYSLPLGDHEKIFACSIDRAQTAGPKYMVAAVSGDLLYCWRIDHPVLDGDVPLFWTRMSPLTPERQRHVTQVALNSAVLLVGGYNGHCMAMDLMQGELLRQVSSKLSRQVLDFRRGDIGGREQFPISHLEVDPDPLQAHAVLTVKEAVQYIDSGADSERIKPLRRNRRAPINRVAAERQAATDINEEIDFNMEMIVLENEEHETQSHLRHEFGMGDMSEEEQLAYAVLLSEQNRQDAPAGGADDDDLARALQMSLEPTESVDEDDELQRALNLSLIEQ